jgi:hypothetical protein
MTPPDDTPQPMYDPELLSDSDLDSLASRICGQLALPRDREERRLQARSLLCWYRRTARRTTGLDRALVARLAADLLAEPPSDTAKSADTAAQPG